MPVINTAADLSMRQVVFQSNYASAKAPANPPAVIAATAGDVMLEACLFTGNANHYVASVPSAKSLTKFYSDPEVNIQILAPGTGADSIVSSPLNTVPAPSNGSWSLFLSDQDDWFKQTRQVRLIYDLMFTSVHCYAAAFQKEIIILYLVTLH